MNRRSFFKGLLTAGAAVVVAPATVLDELAKAEHLRSFESTGRVYVDMGRASLASTIEPTPGHWYAVRSNDWSANSGHIAVAPDGFTFRVNYALAL